MSIWNTEIKMKTEEIKMRKRLGGGKLLLVLCILVEVLSVYRECSRQHAFEIIDDTGEYVYLTREEGEQSGNGYIKEKQALFDLSADTDGQSVSREISIPSGEYRVTLYCDDGGWGDAYCYAYSYANAVSLKSEQVQCSSSDTEKSFCVIADHSISDLQIRLNLETSEFTITRTVIERINRAVCLVFRYIVLDGMAFTIWVLLRYFRKKQPSTEQCIAWAILGAGFFLAVSPILGTGIPDGGDLDFHLWRIEGVKESLLNGDLIPRIYTNLLNSYGYASGILYGDSLLYLPALLRIAGMTVSGAYRAFILIMTALAMGIGYHVFYTMSGRRYIGAMCSVLYVLSAPYALDWYERAGIGSASAAMFVPLVFGALWLLCQEGKENNARAKRWLVIGATGLIQSHIITTFVTALMAVGILMLGFRYYFRKDKLLILIHSTVWILLLNAFFLIPFADYYLTTEMKVNTSDGLAAMQYLGANVQQLLQYHIVGDLSWLTQTVLGISVLSMILLYGMYRVWSGIQEKRADRFENIALIGGSVSLLLCTRYFPWDYLSKQISLVNRMAKSIQFPMRFRNAAIVLIVMLVCMMLKTVYQKSRAACFGMIVVMFLLAVIGNLQVQDAIHEQRERRIYVEETGMRTGFRFQIGAGGEYLPAGVDVDVDNIQIVDEQRIVEHAERAQNRFRMVINNQNGMDGTIELPLLFYKGYTAYDVSTKAHFTADMGMNGRIRVKVPAGYQGTVQVEFKDAWYWNAAEIITALAWVGAAVLGIRMDVWKNRCKEWRRDHGHG